MDEDNIKQIAQDVYTTSQGVGQFSPTQTTFHTHNGTDSSKIKFTDLTNVQVTSVASALTAPTDTPVNGSERFLYDGTNYVQWVYMNNTWQFIKFGTVATTPSQYATTISHNNTGFGSQNYTDTITSTFKPHTVLFYGYSNVVNVRYYTISGYAGITAPTAGACTYLGTGTNTSGGYSSTQLASNGSDYTTVSSWNSDGVTLSTTIGGGGGQPESIQGNVILIG